MPLTGKQLIDRAVLASGGKKITEASALRHIIKNRQSTHIKEAEESVFNSAVLLEKLYKTRLETEKQKILEEIRRYIEALPEPNKSEALLGLARVESYSIDKDGHPHPFGLLKSQRNLSLTTIDILVLAWIGATDPNAVENVTLTPKDIEDRKLSVINAMRKANNEYGPNDPSCYGGMFNALVFSLSGVHRCVLVVLDKHLALIDVKTGFKHQVKSFFDVKQFSDELDDDLSDEKKEMPAEKKDVLRTPDEKENILGAWGLAEPIAEVEQFIEETKRRIKKSLLKKYNKVIPEEEIDALVGTIEYLEKVDLINPNIHAQITKKAMEIFNKLSNTQKQQIFDVWENENKADRVIAEEFLSNVMQEFIQSPEFESSLGFLNLVELENIQRSVIQMKKTDFGIVMQSTVEEDQALKDHPNWVKNKKANTLAVVAKEYTQENYGNVLKKLVEMVSAEAVAVAAIELDTYGNDALMYAAIKQNSENFLALLNKLLETQNGQKAILQSMNRLYEKGYNLLMLIAINKKECCIDFINKLLKIEGGFEALLSSMEKINYYPPKYNAIMLMAKYLSNENFIFFINKMFSMDEKGPASIINAMKNLWKQTDYPDTALLSVAAKYQTKGGLIALLDKIEKTRGGTEAFQQSLLSGGYFVSDAFKYHALMTAAQYQTEGGLIALSKKIVSKASPEIFLLLVKTYSDTSIKSREERNYVHGYNTLMFVMKYQTSEEAIAFLDILLSIDKGPQTLLELIGKTGTNKNGYNLPNEENYNALMLAAQYQTQDVFITLITKLSNIPGGQEEIFKAMQQNGTKTQNSRSKDTNLLLLAAEYQSPENFMKFLDQILHFDIEPKSSRYQGVATLWGGAPKDIRALLLKSIEKIVSVAKFATLVALIRVCLKHDIDAFPSIIKAINNKSHLLTDVECVLISTRADSIISQDISLFATNEMKVADENEVKIHLPEEVQRALEDKPVDIAMQAELLASFSVLKKPSVTAAVPDTHSEAEQLKDQLKSKMPELQKALDAELPGTPKHQIIQKVFLQIRAVVEEKEGKKEDINSLYALEEEIDKDLKNSAKTHSPKLFSSVESVSEQPLTLESMPSVIQEVISLLKKNRPALQVRGQI